MVLLPTVFVFLRACMCVFVCGWACLWKCPLAGLSPQLSQGGRGLNVYVSRLHKLQRAELPAAITQKTQINRIRTKQYHPDSVIQFVSRCGLLCQRPGCALVLSGSISRGRDEQGSRAFIRPEPIVMTSPQGSIHFNYPPLRGLCVRRPGKKHFYMLVKVTDGPRELFRKWGHLRLVSHGENWGIFVFQRDLVKHGEQVVLVKACRSAQHLLSPL